MEQLYALLQGAAWHRYYATLLCVLCRVQTFRV